MNTYMISIALPSEIDENFVSLIPKQRAHINKLMDKDIVLNYSLATDRSKLWVILKAVNEIKAMDILSEFPLIGYMKPEIMKLAFHNSIANEMPRLIMN